MENIRNEFVIDSDDLTKWIHKGIKPEGFENFKYAEVNTNSGDFDNEKGAMTDYEILLCHTDGRIWIAKNEYYNGLTGHVFHSAHFKLHVPEKVFKPIFDGYLNYTIENGKKLFYRDKIKSNDDILNFRLSDFAMNRESLDQTKPIAKITLSIEK